MSADSAEPFTAEDFFRTLRVPFDGRVLEAFRLSILRRFRHYLDEAGAAADGNDSLRRRCLARAYGDYAVSRRPGGCGASGCGPCRR